MMSRKVVAFALLAATILMSAAAQGAGAATCPAGPADPSRGIAIENAGVLSCSWAVKCPAGKFVGVIATATRVGSSEGFTFTTAGSSSAALRASGSVSNVYHLFDASEVTAKLVTSNSLAKATLNYACFSSRCSNNETDRTLLAILSAAYTEDEVPNDKGKVEKRVLLKFSPKIAPVKAAIFPLLKNKPELVEVATKRYKKLQRRWNVFYDASGAIGRRYRRQDEIGTPFGITIDFDTIEKDGTVTLRDRDTCEQRRVTEDELIKFLEEQIGG